MGMNDREREVKLQVTLPGAAGPPGLVQVASYLKILLETEVQETRMGTSRDTYWHAPPDAPRADFLRVRERDGIRQITVKGRDRPAAGNADRLEIDLDCTSPTFRIHRLVRALLGKPAGTVDKTYWVFELESEHDTVCAYEVAGHPESVWVECEAKRTERVDELVEQTTKGLRACGLVVRPAEGSLYEMFVVGYANKGTAK